VKNFTKNDFVYDSHNDVLYYTIGDKSNSYGDENINNIVFMKDINTEELTGITVLDFAKMCFRGDSRLSILSKYFNPREILKSINNKSLIQA